jgi:hypothetical protein
LEGRPRPPIHLQATTTARSNPTAQIKRAS